MQLQKKRKLSKIFHQYILKQSLIYYMAHEYENKIILLLQQDDCTHKRLSLHRTF